MNKKKIVIFALIALAIVAYFQFGLGQYLNLDALKAQQAALDDYHRQHPWQVAGLYFVAYVAVTALSLPGAPQSWNRAAAPLGSSTAAWD